ncbi:MAG: metallophosphoesterase [Promethearchaeota archaeon]
MRTFFTSDHHFGHANIIRHCKRPFSNVAEMNWFMIQRWNQVVGEDDLVYYLGDFCWKKPDCSILSRLKFGRMVFFIGNHDHSGQLKVLNSDKVEFWEDGVVELGGRKFFLTHWPIDASDEYPTICGHMHEKWKILPTGSVVEEFRRGKSEVKLLKQPILNVGVDVHGFEPIPSDRVLELFGETSRNWSVNE